MDIIGGGYDVYPDWLDVKGPPKVKRKMTPKARRAQMSRALRFFIYAAGLILGAKGVQAGLTEWFDYHLQNVPSWLLPIIPTGGAIVSAIVSKVGSMRGSDDDTYLRGDDVWSAIEAVETTAVEVPTAGTFTTTGVSYGSANSNPTGGSRTFITGYVQLGGRGPEDPPAPSAMAPVPSPPWSPAPATEAMPAPFTMGKADEHGVPFTTFQPERTEIPDDIEP